MLDVALNSPFEAKMASRLPGICVPIDQVISFHSVLTRSTGIESSRLYGSIILGFSGRIVRSLLIAATSFSLRTHAGFTS